jgi:phosphoribosylformylglycinamidine cyclo-ligase
MSPSTMTLTYRDAGVDIEAGDDLVDRIKRFAKRTYVPEVVDGIGGFAGLCAVPSGIDEPLLVSGTDGVGTKLKIAFATGRHDTIGQDLVAMCVNDVVTTGARPLFFLDYFACGKLDVGVAEQVIKGIADGCSLAGCALLGGETAELPGMYAEGEYDLAGFSVGVVPRRAVLGPLRVRPGDAIIGIASSGLHSNGFSLVRRVCEQSLKIGFDQHVPELGTTLGTALLTPTRIYAKTVAALAAALGPDLHALCHITGGGIVGNLPRVLPKGSRSTLRLPERSAIFDLIARGGPVEPAEMARTFNLGVGMIALVAEHAVDGALKALAEQAQKAWILGELAVDGGDATPIVTLS